jgi:predicted DNA-binding transcriptional regulator AlpA
MKRSNRRFQSSPASSQEAHRDQHVAPNLLQSRRRFFGSAVAHRQPVPVVEDSPISDGPLLSIEEARDFLNLSSIWAVYRLVRKPGFPVRRLGRALRFDLAELDQWTRRQRADVRPVVLLRGV